MCADEGYRFPERVTGQRIYHARIRQDFGRSIKRTLVGRQDREHPFPSPATLSAFPPMSRHSTDQSKDIDRELKRACEDLISLCSLAATKPIRQFLDQASTYLSRAGPNPDLPAQGFGCPEKVKEVHDQFKDRVREEVEGWRGGLMRYLQDEETVRVLVPPAQVSQAFFPIYFNEVEDQEDRSLIMIPVE